MSSVPAPAPTATIAVVAVHGVAYHAPGESANAMADLLLSLSDATSQARYSSFTSDSIHIPLRPVKVWTYALTSAQGGMGKYLSFLQERSSQFAAYLQNWIRRTGVTPAMGSVGNEFTRDLLRDYDGGADGDTFDTTRLKGKRLVGGPADVHIYEAYWADLTRPQNTILNFGFTLFQLLLHLGSLSRLAVDTGAAENPDKVWTAFRRMQDYAVRFLQLPIPLLNLILLIAALSVLPLQVSVTANRLIAIAFGAILGIAAGLVATRKPAPSAPRKPTWWALRPFLFGVVASTVVGLAGWQASGRHWDYATAVEWWVACTLIYKYVLGKYDQVREGTEEIGWALYVITAGTFVLALWASTGASDVERLTSATLRTMQWILVALRLSWISLFACAIAALILGEWAWRRAKTPDQKARARAAVRTSRMALAVPSLLTLLLATFLWGGVFHWVTTTNLLPCQPLFGAAGKGCQTYNIDVEVPDLPHVPYAHLLILDRREANLQLGRQEAQKLPISDYFLAYIDWSVGPGLLPMLILSSAGLLLLICWVVPSVLTERYPLRSEHVAPRWSTNADSLRLGAWLSRGLDTLPIVAGLFWIAIFAIPLIFVVRSQLAINVSTHLLKPELILSIGVILLGALAIAARHTNSILRPVLDVDNYLRTSPSQATPRAKIAERYVSLLRYIDAYRDNQGQGYSSVVIVAHSLGALISADLLRFLRQEGDSGLTRLGYDGSGNPSAIPVTLFTMGSPLRQLLNRFFPYLYDWVRPGPDGSVQPAAPPDLNMPLPIAAMALPGPADLGLAHWVNAYRSGDYIGRSMWVDEWYGRNLKGFAGGTPDQPIFQVTELPPGSREEMCIVTGAHQHYWDDSAQDIAEELDALV